MDELQNELEQLREEIKNEKRFLKRLGRISKKPRLLKNVTGLFILD